MTVETNNLGASELKNIVYYYTFFVLVRNWVQTRQNTYVSICNKIIMILDMEMLDMYVIRLYKDYNTNKNVGAKIADSSTLQFIEVSWEDLVQTVRKNPNAIKNMEIDKYGRVKLKDLNPNCKIKYYKQHYVDNLLINQYCIITGNSVGRLSFIADSTDGVHCGNNVTVGEIAATLGIPEISKLKMYNAYIEVGTNDYIIYVFNGTNYRKLQSLIVSNVDNVLGPEWEYQVCSIGQDGIRLSYLDRVEEISEAAIPDGVSYIEEFLGGVNSLILPITLKGLGKGCFEEIDDLYKIDLGKGLSNIPERCFRDSSVREVRFSGLEEVIEESAFATSDIRGSVVTGAYIIGKEAFSQTNITALVTVRAKEIGICAFEYCTSLARVRFDDNLLVIKGGAFRGCSKLEEVYLPPNVKQIGKHAFKDCSRLKLARVPVSCNIGEDAFTKRCQIIKY